jgi:hypothetical protein
MIQITRMRPNLIYQNHFDGALACFLLSRGVTPGQQDFNNVKFSFG